MYLTIKLNLNVLFRFPLEFGKSMLMLQLYTLYNTIYLYSLDEQQRVLGVAISALPSS